MACVVTFLAWGLFVLAPRFERREIRWGTVDHLHLKVVFREGPWCGVCFSAHGLSGAAGADDRVPYDEWALDELEELTKGSYP